MAQPIQLQIAPRDPKRELIDRLEAAPEEHAAALLDAYELLQTLHESGLLQMVRGAVGAGSKIVTSASETANSPEAIRAMRNAILMGKLLGSIDPAVLEGLCAAAGQSLGDAGVLARKPPSLFALTGSMLSRDVRRVLGAGVLFLQKFAEHMRVRK